ncbi:DUF3617 domain-containing protein [Arenimonas composti]|uniref:DUF3617 family protein n=1 Tax=Arenimonas composti TR7-09 = DSM 18010 TaxID=1121013 RepID=A0A091BXS0_9GAMM|nr:DUF3617 family protein [Arenimonas composti]KFN49155.1 hypothetical protein P873_11920 [Arenimonas composti TR7-09 = DSM 18010]
MNPIRILSALAIASVVCITGPAFAQAGTGSLYRVTTRMEMVGMPFQMPPQTSEICGPKEPAGERMIPQSDDGDCAVTDFRVNGNKSTFTMTCRGDNPMTGTGEFESLADGYRGSMHMRGTVEGEPIDMRTSFEGRRIRDCNYATESPEAQGRAMLARGCADALTGQTGYPLMLHGQFVGPEAMCASDKPKFCARVTPITGDLNALSEAMALEERMRGQGGMSGGLWESLQGCGLARTAVMTQACATAERTKNYVFVSAHCPDVAPRLCAGADPRQVPDFVVRHCQALAETTARQHCVSRGYTADRANPYRRFCDLFTGQRLRGGDAGGETPADGAPAADAPAAPANEPPARRSLRDRLRDAIGG